MVVFALADCLAPLAGASAISATAQSASHPWSLSCLTDAVVFAIDGFFCLGGSDAMPGGILYHMLSSLATSDAPHRNKDKAPLHLAPNYSS